MSEKAMKLERKSRDVESFVDQLKSEGENVISQVAVNKAVATKIVPTSNVHMEE